MLDVSSMPFMLRKNGNESQWLVPRRFFSHFQASINERIIPEDNVQKCFAAQKILNGISLSNVQSRECLASLREKYMLVYIVAVTGGLNKVRQLSFVRMFRGF